ncbi:hypothetical protein [Actinoplanes teichomyceticus]|uniref:hypothetical protein n=1 Tax=Actinoplanes teichomyceticus TaxID=1867 RepID=UPI0011EB0820|nr:hypothetical protein [Actinoplanes teichomyceticus]
MRHLRSILYALVLAPAAWVLAGVGFTHDLASRGREFFAAESVSGLLLLIFAGILYAIMVFAPVSPAGPTLAGVAYLGVTYWAWNAPQSYVGAWPAGVVKDGFDLSRPGYGLAVLLAVPLLCTALSARRWARYEPPVLPIIGEIGRFRGSARVAGETVAAAQTTVLRAGQPAPRHPADPTVAVPAATPSGSPGTPQPDSTAPTPADATVALPAVPKTPDTPAGATVALPAVPKTPDTPADATVALPAVPKTPAAPAQPRAAAAEEEPTVALRAGGEEPTTVLGSAGAGTASGAPETPETDETGITANSAIPADTGRTGADATAALPPHPAGPNPDDDETEVLSAAALVTPPGEHPGPARPPAEPAPKIPAQRRAPTIES